MSLTSVLGVGFAIAGTLIALLWLPSRAADAPEATAETGRAAAPDATPSLGAGVVAG